MRTADNGSKEATAPTLGEMGHTKQPRNPREEKSRGSSPPRLKPIPSREHAWPSGPATEIALNHSQDWLVADKLPKRFWPPARKPLMAHLTRKPEKPTDHEIVQWV